MRTNWNFYQFAGISMFKDRGSKAPFEKYITIPKITIFGIVNTKKQYRTAFFISNL